MPGTDISHSFNNQLVRPFVTLAIPGLIASAPYYVLAVHWTGRLEVVVPQPKEAIYGLALVTTILFAGLLVDGVASWVEAKVLDTRMNRLTSNAHQRDWEKFLQLNYDGKEPVGHRYLRGLVQSLKHELGTAVALVMAGPGIFVLVATFPKYSPVLVPVLLLAGVMAYWQFIQARTTHELLSDTRATILDAYKPPDAAAAGRSLRPAPPTTAVRTNDVSPLRAVGTSLLFLVAFVLTFYLLVFFHELSHLVEFRRLGGRGGRIVWDWISPYAELPLGNMPLEERGRVAAAGAIGATITAAVALVAASAWLINRRSARRILYGVAFAAFLVMLIQPSDLVPKNAPCPDGVRTDGAANDGDCLTATRGVYATTQAEIWSRAIGLLTLLGVLALGMMRLSSTK